MKFLSSSYIFIDHVESLPTNRQNKLFHFYLNGPDYLDFSVKVDFFSFKSDRKFNFVYFAQTRFFFFEKPKASKLLDYSGSHFKNKNNYINTLLKSSLRGGNKLLMLKHFNFFHNGFYFLFNEWNEFLSKKFNTYDVYYEISDQNPRFFNINLLLKSILDLNESMFNVRVVKFTKKQKRHFKIKKKFFSSVVYLPKYKRNRSVLKCIHTFSNQYNYYNYFERLLMSFCESFFFQKNSFLYKRKVYMYKNAFSTPKS